MKQKFRYKNIFIYSSLQFSGHVEEYFARHTQKLVVFVVMPRVKSKKNLVRWYQKGKLIEEKEVWSSNNFFLYYASWYFHYLWFLFTYFKRTEPVIVFSGHPISFLGMWFQKRLRQVNFAYWIGDYYPPVKLSLILFEKLKKHYHDIIPCTYYLADRINAILNGRILKTRNRRTVMWGVKSNMMQRRNSSRKMSILFVGLIKEGQGLELIFKFLKRHSGYALKIIGLCDDPLYQKYQKMMLRYAIAKRVYFPNRFYSDIELRKIAKTCHLGVAMYDSGPLTATYYTDPGKIKAYAELGLPIVMSDTSGIAPFIKRFKCGEVIQNRELELEEALLKIRHNYVQYIDGLQRFVKYFDFESYYRKSFVGLER